MAQVFGSIDSFAFDTDDITEWFERLEQWFVANNIDDGTRKRALLLSNIGARGYKLARSLSQNKPTEKSFEELKKLLLDHINPKPNEISQRFVFYRRDRRSGETVKDYVAQLRDRAQISATKLDVYWLGNPSVSVPRNGERTRPGSLTHGIHIEDIGAHFDRPIRR